MVDAPVPSTGLNYIVIPPALPLTVHTPEKARCTHKKALGRSFCKDCGKPTRSHLVDGTVPQRAVCPSCGQVVDVAVPVAQCHGCWEREHPPEVITDAQSHT